MYGIYANIWVILMVNVTIYGIHGSYGIGSVNCDLKFKKASLCCKESHGLGFPQLKETPRYGGFLKEGYPQIIHFNGIFPYKPSSYWDTPIYGNPHMCAYIRSVQHPSKDMLQGPGYLLVKPMVFRQWCPRQSRHVSLCFPYEK